MLSLVIPTYNERKSLQVLLPRLAALVPKLGGPVEFIVVDDNSPDETAEFAASFEVPEPAVIRVVKRAGKFGLASAVIDGWRTARGSVLGVMDADGSHDETIIPEDGLVWRPDFGGNAPQISGMTLLGAGAIERFWSIPQDQFDTEAILVPAGADNGIYNLERGDIFQANVERCMSVAYVYVINDSEEGRCIQLGVGSDDSLAVKVNGHFAGGYQRCAPHNPFDQKIPVWLDPGKNMIAIATYENGGG